MIRLQNITTEEYKEELKAMLYAHYDELFGEDWAGKISKKFKNSYQNAKSDLKELFEKHKYGTLAFGIFNEDNDKLLGFVLLDLFYTKPQNKRMDNYGQIYQLYIKPEYRLDFLLGAKDSVFIKKLRDYLDGYFLSNGVHDVLSNIPSEITYLIDCGKALGFEKTNKSSTKSGYETTLWQKKL